MRTDWGNDSPKYFGKHIAKATEGYIVVNVLAMPRE